ncbi:MAG: branched-chain amino acid ABC transporter permease [Chloroflexi bacterium]|nr:branched-chain amino acid ABC transporter permease [Chloroflexota bacterium]
MAEFTQYLMNGLMVGGVYGLIALSIVLIYKSTRVFNFAVGDIMLLGGFVLWSLLAWLNLPLLPSLLFALAIAFGIGLLIERLALRPLIGQPILAAIMATLALSIFLKGAMILIWGTGQIAYPTKISPGTSMTLDTVTLSSGLLWAFLLAMAAFVVLVWFFQSTKMGLQMRATAEDHQLAQSTGISVKLVFGLTWAMASLVCALSGISLGDRLGLSVGMTPLLALKAFPAVFLGGLESIPGAIVGGLAIGILENLVGGLINPNLMEITPYIILLVILLFRAEGLFGLKRIERI